MKRAETSRKPRGGRPCCQVSAARPGRHPANMPGQRKTAKLNGVVVSVEREFLEVVAIKDEVKAALYTTTIHLAAVEGNGIDYPQLLL